MGHCGTRRSVSASGGLEGLTQAPWGTRKSGLFKDRPVHLLFFVFRRRGTRILNSRGRILTLAVLQCLMALILLPFRPMMHFVLCVAALMVCGIAFVIYAAAKAPIGYEDEEGFHLGPEVSSRPIEIEGALPQPIH